MDTLNHFRKNGYIVLTNLFSDQEIDHWQTECDRLLADPLVHPDNRRTPFRMGASELPERIDPVTDISPAFAALVTDERLVGPVTSILGEAPVLFKDKLLLKAPGVEGYTMHQDWAWGWQELCPAHDILSVSIQIDGADHDNGAIELYQGYHDELLTPAGESRNMNATEIATIDPKRGQLMQTKPGDVLIFHSLAPHKSGPNQSSRHRRSLYLTMNAASHGDLRTAYYRHYRHHIEDGAAYFK